MDSDWQTNFNTFQERNLYILKNGLRADCSFLAGVVPEDRRVFHAQKLLLANASPVFETMFFGSLPEKGDKPIEVLDIEANDFENLLQFIYTYEIKIANVAQAQRLYYSAEKYMLIPLKKTCMQFLSKYVDCNNVIAMFEFAKRFKEKTLEQLCTNIIQNNTTALLGSTSYLNADVSTLDFILDQNYLGIRDELELFTALEKYANRRFLIKRRVDCNSMCQKCQQQKSESSASQGNKYEKTQDTLCRKIVPLENILKLFRKIRFLTLTVDEFVQGPANSNWISESDAFKILLCIMGKRKIEHFPIGFNASNQSRNSAYRSNFNQRLHFSFAVTSLPTKTTFL